MDWQMRWSLLTFLGGWDDKQDRKMRVKVIIILGANDDKIFSSSLAA